MLWPAARHRLCAPLAVVALCATSAPAAAIGPGQTLLESGPSGGAFLPLANVNDSFTGSGKRTVSADGHVVVFVSRADGLSAEDDDRLDNIFVRNTDTGATTLVSRATGAGGAAANGDSYGPVISADGTKVAFASRATNLADGDANNDYDVFVRDLTAGTTSAASRIDGAGGALGNAFSGDPAIAVDSNGHVIVAFESEATDLVSGDTDSAEDVFVRDVTAGTTTLVSRTSGGGLGTADSYDAAISRDGQHVAFDSDGQLDAADTHVGRDVYVRHLGAGTTEYASRAAAASNGDSFGPSLDQDGTDVVFVSNASNLGGSVVGNSTYHVYRHTLGGTTTVLVDQPDGTSAGTPGNGSAFSATISDDAGAVAFASDATNLTGVTDDNGTRDVFVRRIGSNATELASRADGASGTLADGSSSRPSLSNDGTTVAFESRAPNLSPANDDDFSNVYTRAGSATQFVSRPSGSGSFVSGTHDATDAALSADGRYVAFISTSDSLSPADNDGVRNVYVRDNSTGVVTFASRSFSGNAADGDSSAPTLSADGSKLAFLSTADNLVGGVAAGTQHVYVRDMATGAMTLATRPDGDSVGVADASSFAPRISGDGSHVMFRSAASNLVGGFTNGFHIYLRDLTTNHTRLVDVAKDGTSPANDSAFDGGDLDASGSKVVFASIATDLVDGVTTPATRIYLRDLGAATTVVVSREDGAGGNVVQGFTPSMDASGTRIAFATPVPIDPADSGTGLDVYVRDVTAGSTQLVSRFAGAGGAPVNAVTGDPPSIDDAGRAVVFGTRAGLDAADDNDKVDVYVRDVAAGTTELESRADGNGSVGNAASERPQLAANACCVAFDSSATNLTAGSPGPDFAQVYLHGLGSPPPATGGSGGVPTGGGSPAPAALADTRAPVLKLGGAKTQKLGKVLVVTAIVDEAARVTATATVSLPRLSKVLRFGPKTVTAAAGKRVTIRLKIPVKARSAIGRALAKKKRVAAKVTVRARDAAGNRSSARRTIKLKR